MGVNRTEEFRQDAMRLALTSGLTRKQVADDLVLSRFSSGLFRAMFAMKEIENGKEIHRRVSA